MAPHSSKVTLRAKLCFEPLGRPRRLPVHSAPRLKGLPVFVQLLLPLWSSLVLSCTVSYAFQGAS
jgi:hypothetical protein